MPTRWIDNDAHGHMNNIVHYALIDTAVTDWQRNHGFFDEEHKSLEFMVVGGCRYFSEAAYPDKIAVGLRIKKKLAIHHGYMRWGSFREEDKLHKSRFSSVFLDCKNRRQTLSLKKCVMH